MAQAPKERKTREKSPVAINNIWSECVSKEKAKQKVYEHFTINPRKLFPQPDKPTCNTMVLKSFKPNPNNPMFSEDYTQVGQKTADLEPDLLSKLSSVNFPPRNKYPFPQTSNQELGWHNHESRSLSPKRFDNKFTYPRKKCPETEYANDYFNMQHVSPFSNKFK